MGKRVLGVVAGVLICLGTGGSAPGQSEGSLAQPPSLDVVAIRYDTGSQQFLEPFRFVNELVKADLFYSLGYFGSGIIIANVEAGHIWDGHEVFDRSLLGLGPAVTQTFNAAPDVSSPDLGEIDYHATTVGHVLAGSGLMLNELNQLDFTLTGIGMAPLAELWSGAIATTYSTTNIGSFSISQASLLAAYLPAFRGVNGDKADVVNSSWGGTDPAGSLGVSLLVDALAAENPTVAFVASSGNSGFGTGTVGGPGSGYNGITVGSLGGLTNEPPFQTPSSFSSGGPVDFYNPQTGETLSGVRAAVDIAAPGEFFYLAAYLGPSGSLEGTSFVQDPSPEDLYFLNMSGTSYAAPVVAGGIALIKEALQDPINGLSPETAFDTRVVKSALMAGAAVTDGWDNGQFVDGGGVVRTTQGLDFSTGAGQLDLERTAAIYWQGTRDVAGTGGGAIAATGYDFGTLALGGSNDYVFDLVFPEYVELTISLNWFVNREMNGTDTGGMEVSFANLDLQVWSVIENDSLFTFDSIVAESASLYNNTEFLRLLLPEEGRYGIRIGFYGMAYDLSDSQNEESYGLAWLAVQGSAPAAVPEPGAAGLLLMFGIWRLALRMRRR